MNYLILTLAIMPLSLQALITPDYLISLVSQPPPNGPLSLREICRGCNRDHVLAEEGSPADAPIDKMSCQP